VVGAPRRLVGLKTLAEVVSRNTFVPVELSQTVLNLGVDGRFVRFKPSLPFALYFESVEKYVFYALERAAVQPLLNECFNFGTVIRWSWLGPC
jgi:hypothetical protein